DDVITVATAAAAVSVIDVAAGIVAENFVDAAISVIVYAVAALGRFHRDAYWPGVIPLRRLQRGAPTGDTKGYGRPQCDAQTKQGPESRTILKQLRRAFQRLT